MAVTVKENRNPEVMLEEQKDILEQPPPRPETPRDGENEDAARARNLRDKLARDREMLENEKRRTRGPRVGHKVFFTMKYKRNWCPDYSSLSGQKTRNDFYRKIHTPKSPKCHSGTLQS